MDDGPPDWLRLLREERADLERLVAYARAVTADRIPTFILDPMLGVPPRQREDD